MLVKFQNDENFRDIKDFQIFLVAIHRILLCNLRLIYPKIDCKLYSNEKKAEFPDKVLS